MLSSPLLKIDDYDGNSVFFMENGFLCRFQSYFHDVAA
jgi:hypothetical protein